MLEYQTMKSSVSRPVQPLNPLTPLGGEGAMLGRYSLYDRLTFTIINEFSYARSQRDSPLT